MTSETPDREPAYHLNVRHKHSDGTEYGIYWPEGGNPTLEIACTEENGADLSGYLIEPHPLGGLLDLRPLPSNPEAMALMKLVFSLAERLEAADLEIAELKDELWSSEDAATVAAAVVQAAYREAGLPDIHKSMDAPLPAALTVGMGNIISSYARRTENLLQERDALFAELEASSRNHAQSAHDATYWFRRCSLVEGALIPFADLHEAVSAQKNNEGMNVFCYPVDIAHAHLAMAESRKPGLDSNLEIFARDRRQERTLAWAIRTFTGTDCRDPGERVRRLVEEAVEMMQAVYIHFNNPRDWCIDLRAIQDRVEGRPAGALDRELGGLTVTLNCLAQVLGLSVATEEQNELERVLAVPPEEFRARHAAKVEVGI